MRQTIGSNIFLIQLLTDISYYGAICNDEDKDDISKYFAPTADFMEDAFAAGGRDRKLCWWHIPLLHHHRVLPHAEEGDGLGRGSHLHAAEERDFSQ